MRVVTIMLKQIVLVIILLFSSTSVFADTDENLAKAGQIPLSRNPISKYYTLPFINDLNFGYGQQSRTQDELQLKPVIPFQLTEYYDLILRPILLFYHQPANYPRTGYINGWGDINPTAFLSPAKTRTLIWGVGPSLFIPTASNRALGTGKWSIGPQLALFYMPKSWLAGFLTSNVWSIAGDPSRASVNQFSFQYFISYHFSRGWYVTTQPTITANWKAPGSQQWTVPFGIGPGRAFYIGKQAVDLSLQTYFNAMSPANTGANWTIELKFNLMFPDQKMRVI